MRIFETLDLSNEVMNNDVLHWIHTKFGKMFSKQRLQWTPIVFKWTYKRVSFYNKEKYHYVVLLLLGAYGPLVSPNAMRQRPERTPQQQDPCSSRDRTPVLEPSWEQTLRTQDAWKRRMMMMMMTTTEQE